ncbi:hypothetical protein EC968_009405 [Mortierella alpina]|nr:hypothetical protein EC968_009405 [Mortierella alpina]
MHAVPAFTNDEELARRLRAACDQPLSVAHNESPHITFLRLLEHGLVADCSSSGIAQYIARTILNWSINHEKPSPFDFRLELGPEQSIAIPSRSRLMIWHLVRSLKITIVLLSTRRKSHVFAVERPHATIGFLHRVDSYHGTSEFLVLMKTRTPPVSRISVDPPLALTYGVDVATIKGMADETNVKPSHNVSKEQCRQGIRVACAQVLREMADKKAGDVVKKPQPLPGQSEAQFRKSQGDEFRNTEFSRTRLPRGRDQSNNISIWHEVVETKCDGLWDTALKQAEKDQKAAKSKQPSSSKPSGSGRGPPATGTEEADDVVEQEVDKEKENLRTCTVTLKNVLRPDLVQHMDSIVAAVEEKAALSH